MEHDKHTISNRSNIFINQIKLNQMEVTEEIAKELSSYNLLRITINAHLNVYKEMLSEYETGLKEYLKQDIPPSLLDVQHILISKTKAKISALEDLNN